MEIKKSKPREKGILLIHKLSNMKKFVSKKEIVNMHTNLEKINY